jgi:hypothetical protein
VEVHTAAPSNLREVSTADKKGRMPGVRRHPGGASWQVRIAPFPSEAGFATLDEANERAVELLKLRRQGIRTAPSRKGTEPLATIRDYAEKHLQRLGTIGGRNGVPYSEAGLAKARQECRPWLGEPIPDRRRKGVVIEAPKAITKDGRPLAELPVMAATLQPFEDYLQQRAQTSRRAAVGERQQLMNILALAQRRGEDVSSALLALEPIRRNTIKRRGLTLDELRFLANYADESQRRVLLLGGTLGGRIMELLRSEDAWFDLDALRVTLPAWATKERRERRLRLLAEEVALIREQQLVRSPNTHRGPKALAICSRDHRGRRGRRIQASGTPS